MRFLRKCTKLQNNLAEKLNCLEIDEFGDQVFDCTNIDDAKSQKFINACKVMKFWISKAMGEKIIKLTKNRETAKAEVSQNDSNIQDTTNRQQVEAYEKAVQTLFIDFKQSEYEQDSKLNSLDSENQDNVDEALTSKQHKKRKFLGSFISSGITTFTKPFQFYVKKEEKQVAHPVDKLMSSFIKNYNKKKGSLSQIKSFPVKMLLRIINDVNEKAKVFNIIYLYLFLNYEYNLFSK